MAANTTSRPGAGGKMLLVPEAQPLQVRFAVIGDYGTDNKAEADVAALVRKWNVDFVVTVGDNRYGPRTYERVIGRYWCDYLPPPSWKGCKRSRGGPIDMAMSRTRRDHRLNAFFPAPGNHDYSDGGGIEEYLEYFDLPGSDTLTTRTSKSELYYDHAHGQYAHGKGVLDKIHFFVIDSTAVLKNGRRDPQKEWLERRLKTSKAMWKVVQLHHPPYSSAGVHGSTEALQESSLHSFHPIRGTLPTCHTFPICHSFPICHTFPIRDTFPICRTFPICDAFPPFARKYL